jgi:molybdopterin/thiamine biosynthesis adenylyltransferase
MGRYERNHPAISENEQETLARKRVIVAGCGGLGGYIVEALGRIGVGHITVVDGDVFADSNLNRQLYSSEETLGQPKPLCAERRMKTVNPGITIRPVCENLTADNAEALLRGQDVAIDALDNGKARLLLAQTARSLGIPLVSGAISGWRGRVLVLYPEDNADFLWSGEGGGVIAGNLPFTAACTASVEAAETVKVLLCRQGVLKNRLLEFDLLSGRWEEIPLDAE